MGPEWVPKGFPTICRFFLAQGSFADKRTHADQQTILRDDFLEPREQFVARTPVRVDHCVRRATLDGA